jgi:membrane protease YdiL (CAAX protease family)
MPIFLPTANQRLRAPPVASATWLGICAIGALALPAGDVLRSIVLAPLVEEAVLRLGLHDALSRRAWAPARRFAPLLSALAFAAAHMALARDAQDLPRAAATALPAWWIGARYERDRRLAPCVAWHAAFNLAWLLAHA